MLLHGADWCWSAGGITDWAVERSFGRLILVRTVWPDSLGTEHCAGGLMSGKIKNIFIVQRCLSKSKTFGRRRADPVSTAGRQSVPYAQQRPASQQRPLPFAPGALHDDFVKTDGNPNLVAILSE